MRGFLVSDGRPRIHLHPSRRSLEDGFLVSTACCQSPAYVAADPQTGAVYASTYEGPPGPHSHGVHVWKWRGGALVPQVRVCEPSPPVMKQHIRAPHRRTRAPSGLRAMGTRAVPSPS